MRLLIAISTRYYRSYEGKIWTKTTYNSHMWREVLDVFEDIHILARVLDVKTLPEGAMTADNQGVTYYSLPEWNSWKGLFLIKKCFSIAKKAVFESDAILLHSPSLEADLAYFWAKRTKKPIMVECRGEQTMSEKYWKSRNVILCDLLSRYHIRQFKEHLSASWGCIFVAEQLRRNYAAYLRNGSQVEVVSDIRLPDHFFTEPRNFYGMEGKCLKFVNVGRLEAQKDQSTLIKACSTLIDLGFTNWELHLVGEGPLRQSLQRLARSVGIGDKVFFHGFVPWGEVLFCLLDKMDVFILSSMSEGMPRVLLEAMARGLPCISTAVSGADELIMSEDLIPVGRADLLATWMAETIKSSEFLNKLAQSCWSRVQFFRLDYLKNRKKKFLLDYYDYVEQLNSSHSV